MIKMTYDKWHRAREQRREISRIFSSKHEFIPETEKVMRCSNEFFTAGAVWKRIAGKWQCIQAEPIIKWMKGMDAGAAKIELARRGCDYEWL